MGLLKGGVNLLTASISLVRKAILASFSLTLSNSDSVNSPSKNPVSLITALMTSCKNRNGGFFSSFSVKTGFFTYFPKVFCVFTIISGPTSDIFRSSC